MNSRYVLAIAIGITRQMDKDRHVRQCVATNTIYPRRVLPVVSQEVMLK